MHYLYGAKKDKPMRLVATFDGEQQLLSYVRWATLEDFGDGKGKFEQGSALAGCERWETSASPQGDDEPDSVPHNPSPTML